MADRPKPITRGVRAAIAKHVAALRTAASPAEIENAFQAAISELGYAGSRLKPVRAAMEERGRELCATHPQGAFVPTFGPRRVLKVCGETYRVARGQNSAGVRYAWHYAEEWATGLMRSCGLSESATKGVWGWWSSYPHRALQVLDDLDAVPLTKGGAA